MVSKNNRLPFIILALTFIAYFGGWAYINQHAHMQTNWPAWRVTLLMGCIYLIGLFFAAGDDDFSVTTILFTLGCFLGLIPIIYILCSVAAWQLPVPNADNVKFLFSFLAAGACVGGMLASY